MLRQLIPVLGLTLVVDFAKSAFPRTSMLSSRFKNRLLAAFAIFFALNPFSANADLFTTCGVDLGAAGRTKSWAIFSLGGGITTAADATGSSYIGGDVGAAGNGNVNLGGNAILDGDLYYHTPGVLRVKGNSRITGTTHQNAATDALLNQGVIDAMNASTAAWNHAISPQYAGFALKKNKNNFLTAAPGECVVLRLTDFVLTSGTLTLTGSANSAFIINVTGQFSLSNHSNIILAGGITWDSVLFNVRGSGSTVSLSGQSTLNGILMANNRTVNLSGGSTVNGEVIANSVSMSGGSRVVRPPVASP